ncbi:hypothetical protein AMECASPLE_039570 [Ameca splendens]|uniref:Uncharacterized protein n=1 Tax=Ameca splendens TaxID=208324 RepID=A0ABV1A6H3_9TELE
MFKKTFKAMLDEAVIYKKGEHTRNETIYKLLDEARSLTDQKQLKIFKQNLQGLVDQADRRKIKEKNCIAAFTKHYFKDGSVLSCCGATEKYVHC